MDLEKLVSDIRAFLQNHPDRARNQPKLAARIDVPLSWLNKFINGKFSNVRPARLNRLKAWYDAERRLIESKPTEKATSTAGQEINA